MKAKDLMYHFKGQSTTHTLQAMQKTYVHVTQLTEKHIQWNLSNVEMWCPYFRHQFVYIIIYHWDLRKSSLHISEVSSVVNRVHAYTTILLHVSVL